KKLFSMNLEKVKHPSAKDVLNKKPTIIRLNGEQARMTQIVAFFDDAYGTLQWGDCKELEPDDDKILVLHGRRRITKDMFKWNKANGKYDKEKQFEAFSKTIKSEFKKDPEMKNMKDIEIGNTVIIDNSSTQMTYEAKYKTVCELLVIAKPFHWEGVRGMQENPFGVALSLAVN
ncbi:hypothetical protein Tco_1197291, partial [Tanacetum coccineum]